MESEIKKKDLYLEIEVPEGVQVRKEGGYDAVVEGPQGSVRKTLRHPLIDWNVEGNLIKINPKKNTKREKKIRGTFESHLRNMISGVQEKFEYVLKICSGHFPMTVTVENGFVKVKNFLGEKIPRMARILDDVDVKVEGDKVIITSVDKEAAGQTAANIESSTRIKNRDERIFQDGIYIINKCGKDLR